MTTVTNRAKMIAVPILLGVALAVGCAHPSYADTPSLASMTSIAAQLHCLNNRTSESFQVSIASDTVGSSEMSSLVNPSAGGGPEDDGTFTVQERPVVFLTLTYPTSSDVRVLQVFRDGVSMGNLKLDGRACLHPLTVPSHPAVHQSPRPPVGPHRVTTAPTAVKVSIVRNGSLAMLQRQLLSGVIS